MRLSLLVSLVISLTALAHPSIAKPSKTLRFWDQKTTKLAAVQQIAWSNSPSSLSLGGRLDQNFTYLCPPNGTIGSVWGTDVYLDDSSICSAAVHAGLITAVNGGQVTIKIRPGANFYNRSVRNGVSSASYGSWNGSFIFLNSKGVAVITGLQIRLIDWSVDATALRGRLDQNFTYLCPPNGTIGSVWGTDVYLDDSSICTAAVHAGLITAVNGGQVTIKIRPGENAYNRSTRNGVSSASYSSWYGSFIFVAPPILSLEWYTPATFLRENIDKNFTYLCPPNGTISNVWGTDVYTDDSSICTAAVHAGLITAINGGQVTIKIRPGATAYSGSTRNGVSSNSYSGYYGSFIFFK